MVILIDSVVKIMPVQHHAESACRMLEEGREVIYRAVERVRSRYKVSIRFCGDFEKRLQGCCLENQ